MKNTEYLKWGKGTLTILLNWSGEERIICDEHTEIVHVASGGFSGFRINGIILSSAIGHQLHKHVVFLRKELYGDILKINFEHLK